MRSVLNFARSSSQPSKRYSLAFIASCATENTYCQSGVAGVKAAAAKYGASVHVYNSSFNPATQVGQVQNASTQGYDGYLFEPAASASACSMWRQYLQPSSSPFVILDLPMCDSADYTPGTAGIVTMQRKAYYQQVVDDAFSHCKTSCEAAAVGGFTGSDLFTYWEDALKAAEAKYPKVHLVVNQPGNFDARTAFGVIQDGLRAHPNISLVVSSWDAMTRGVTQAIVAAGKKPGKDVKIYSIGGTKAGLADLRNDTWNTTYVLLPYQEGYYAVITLMMALQGHPLNAFVNEAMLPPVASGPGTIAITRANESQFHPDY